MSASARVRRPRPARPGTYIPGAPRSGRMIGKVRPDDLESLVFDRTGAPDDAVAMGPRYGEDTAAIDLGDRTLVVSSDPISLAVGRIGTLGVHVACNDVAASGADPRWLTVVVFLPDDGVLDEITRQLDETARSIGVAIVGGHSEYAPDRDRPLLCLTSLGLADAYVPTGGARTGDRVLLTKGAGIEGTAILATDFRERLDLPAAVLDRAAGFYDDVSVVPEAAVLRGVATAMHDPTEGGLIDGLLELAAASGVAIDVEADAIPIREETARICEAAGVDPFRIFGSGALLAAVPESETAAALEALAGADVEAAAIGTVREADTPSVAIGGEVVDQPVRDDLYALWE